MNPQKPVNGAFRHLRSGERSTMLSVGSASERLPLAASELFEKRAHVDRQLGLESNDRARQGMREPDLCGVQGLPRDRR
jgi:hypothetical protein